MQGTVERLRQEWVSKKEYEEPQDKERLFRLQPEKNTPPLYRETHPQLADPQNTLSPNQLEAFHHSVRIYVVRSSIYSKNNSGYPYHSFASVSGAQEPNVVSWQP